MKLLFVLIGLFQCTAVSGQALKAYALTVEGRETMWGLDKPEPRLSWKLEASGRDVKQLAYRIIVSGSLSNLANDKGDIWDSGDIKSDASLNIPFDGKKLQSYQSCYWKVKVWTNKGTTGWSKPSHWTMGILDPAEWKASWIGMNGYSAADQPDSTFTRLAARYLRKTVSLKKEIQSATAFISGLGLYEFYINGRKVSDDVLAPTVSEYNKKIFYNTFDVTAHMKNGANAIGVILGNGRFFGMRNYHGQPDPLTGIPQTSYGLPRMLLQIKVNYTDGTTETIISDKSWKVTDQGPIIANNEYDGEEYDANKELTNWSLPGYNDAFWKPVDIMEPEAKRIVSQPNENIRIKQVLKPLSVHKTKTGSYIIDMGENMVGWVSIKVKGKKGDTITMRFAEKLKTNDSLYLDNVRHAKVTDKYILKGAASEQWEPRFTYHGFRYAEVKGLSYAPAVSDFQGKVVYDDIAGIGSFTTSNATINAVLESARRTIRGNYRGMPTDCPQRDERTGWLGDRVISSYGESFLFDNARLYAKWLDDIQDAQKDNGSVPDIVPTFWDRYADNVTYPSAYILIPEMLRKQFGDVESIKAQYPAMKKWMMYMWDTYREDDLVLKDNYGDWCVPPESLDLIWSKDSSRITDGGLLAASYYYYCLTLMKQYAQSLGLDADVQSFEKIAAKVHLAFNKKFYHADSAYYANNTITANLLPLTFGLAPEKDRQEIFKQILGRLEKSDNHVSTGIIGGMWLMRGLSDNGAADVAYKLATNTTYPSWGYMMEQGATTIWELWNGDAANPMMNSGNHQMLLGDLLIWYYEYLAGIKTDATKVAFSKIVMDPVFPAGLDFVNASYNSRYGMIKSAWKKTGKALEWNITIPPNTTAAVHLPTTAINGILESGKPVNMNKDIVQAGNKEGKTVIEIGSGTYHFSVKQ